MKPGEQPLRSKGRGRVVHVSDFIIEDTASGRLALTADQILAQLELPLAPTQFEPTPVLNTPPVGSTAIPSEPSAAPNGTGSKPKKTTKSKKAPKPKNVRTAPATGRTEADHSWVHHLHPTAFLIDCPSSMHGKLSIPGRSTIPGGTCRSSLNKYIFIFKSFHVC
jgi:hypothetical protein